MAASPYVTAPRLLVVHDWPPSVVRWIPETSPPASMVDPVPGLATMTVMNPPAHRPDWTVVTAWGLSRRWEGADVAGAASTRATPRATASDSRTRDGGRVRLCMAGRRAAYPIGSSSGN